MVPEKFLAGQNELLRAHCDTPDGKPDPKPEHWQFLADHLRNVADLAEKFAGLLHDL
jgi:hypothetical protein